MDNLVACLRLARTDFIGPHRWQQLIARYHTPQAALDALPSVRIRGTAPPAPPGTDQVMREIDATLKLGGQFITLLDASYPRLLRECPDAPPVLICLGNPAYLNQQSIGIVGARNASAQGMKIAENLATDLVESGLSVVSGLARGIDRAAHLGSLHRTGRAIAAIAGGLDCPYPPENIKLQNEIGEKGVVITEAPAGTFPTARHFPRRNRLIAGLSAGCVVIEASMQSGTLITARLAAGYGREIFAVPGTPLDPRNKGSNDLLRQGAVLTESAADVLAALPPFPCQESSSEASLRGTHSPSQSFFSFSAMEAEKMTTPPENRTKSASEAENEAKENKKIKEKILDLLSYTPLPVDDLVRHCQFSPSMVLTALTELELEGDITVLPGGRVVLAA